MTIGCNDLDRYLDHELTKSERFEFRAHLVGCPICQRDLSESMQLTALESRDPALDEKNVTQSDDKPDGPSCEACTRDDETNVPSNVLHLEGRFRRRWIPVTVIIAAATAVVFLLGRSPHEPKATDSRLTLATSGRATEGRFHSTLDAPHRPYAVLRGGSSEEVVPSAVLATLEAHHRWADLVVAHANNGEFESAKRILRKLKSPAANNDRAALAIAEHRPQEALITADAALAEVPDMVEAKWNRALALRDMHLPLSAAKEMTLLSERGEPGWSQEASEIAKQQRQYYAARLADNQATKTAITALMTSLVRIPTKIVSRSPSQVGPAAYRLALRNHHGDIDAALELAKLLRDKDLDQFIEWAQTAKLAPQRNLERFFKHINIDVDDQNDAVIQSMRAIAAATPSSYLKAIAAHAQAHYNLYQTHNYDRALAITDAAVAQWCHSVLLTGVCGELDALGGTALAALGRSADAIERLERVRAQAIEQNNLLLENSALYRLGEGLLDSHSDDASFSLAMAYLGEEQLRRPNCNAFVAIQLKVAGWQADRKRWKAARNTLRIAHEKARRDCPEREHTVTSLMTEADVAIALREKPLATSVLRAIKDMQGETSGAMKQALEFSKATVTQFLNPERGIPLFEAIATSSSEFKKLAQEELAITDARRSHWEQAVQRLNLHPCNVAITSWRQVLVLAVDPKGRTKGDFLPPRESQTPTTTAPDILSAEIISHLSDCEIVEVVASGSFYGMPQMLPKTMAWHYRALSRKGAFKQPGEGERLFVLNVETPRSMKLPPLAKMLRPSPGISLEGPAATPSAVMRALGSANYVEIHAHGITRVNGVNHIVLSPDSDGTFTLTAGDLRALKLNHHPVIVLAACDVGRVGGDQPWGLAEAFIEAGASAVLASTSPIPDLSAPTFFANLRTFADHMDISTALQKAVREQPQPAGWTKSLVLFR